MKKKPAPRPFDTFSWWRGSFEYTEEQAQAILKAWGNPENSTEILQAVHRIVWAYQHNAEDSDRPRWRSPKGQLATLSARIVALKKALIDLDPPALDAVKDILSEQGVDDSQNWDVELKTFLDNFLRQGVNRAKCKGLPRGRPTDDALWRFLFQLYQLWTRLKGTPPKRSYDPYAGKDYGPFYDFVYAVVEPVRDKRGLEIAIRRLLDFMVKNTP